MMDEDKRREHFYDTVARLVSKLRLTLNPSDAFGVISDEVRELTGASYAVVFLVDEDSQYVRVAGISGVDASKIGALPTVHIDEAFRRSVAGRSESAPRKSVV